MDEAVRDGGPGDVGDQAPAPLHGDMLENHQLNREGSSRGPIDRAESGTPSGCGARCARPQAHLAMCVVLHPLRRRGRISSC
jgi:hypothetical protein